MLKLFEYIKNFLGEKKIINWASKSYVRTSFYYTFFSTQFHREHYAVLHGKTHHLEQLKNNSAGIFTLRRNTHRIEKGLSSMPLKPVFAEGFIMETVEAFHDVMQYYPEDSSVFWAYDVLINYFDTVTVTPKINKAKQFFDQTNKLYHQKTKEGKQIPFKRIAGVRSTIDFDQFYKLCQQRRSVRWYTKEKVPRTLIEKAVNAAAYSPSACNRQPFRFIVVDDEQQLKEVSYFPMGTKVFAHNVPCMILVIGDLSAYFDERDRHLIYIDGALASMSLMFAFETLGLASCPINWPDIESREAEMSAYFKLEKHERCLMFMSVGYPLDEGMIPHSSKKIANELIIYSNEKQEN